MKKLLATITLSTFIFSIYVPAAFAANDAPPAAFAANDSLTAPPGLVTAENIAEFEATNAYTAGYSPKIIEVSIFVVALTAMALAVSSDSSSGHGD